MIMAFLQLLNRGRRLVLIPYLLATAGCSGQAGSPRTVCDLSALKDVRERVPAAQFARLTRTAMQLEPMLSYGPPDLSSLVRPHPPVRPSASIDTLWARDSATVRWALALLIANPAFSSGDVAQNASYEYGRLSGDPVPVFAMLRDYAWPSDRTYFGLQALHADRVGSRERAVLRAVACRARADSAALAAVIPRVGNQDQFRMEIVYVEYVARAASELAQKSPE